MEIEKKISINDARILLYTEASIQSVVFHNYEAYIFKVATLVQLAINSDYLVVMRHLTGLMIALIFIQMIHNLRCLVAVLKLHLIGEEIAAPDGDLTNKLIIGD